MTYAQWRQREWEHRHEIQHPIDKHSNKLLVVCPVLAALIAWAYFAKPQFDWHHQREATATVTNHAPLMSSIQSDSGGASSLIYSTQSTGSVWTSTVAHPSVRIAWDPTDGVMIAFTETGTYAYKPKQESRDQQHE